MVGVVDMTCVPLKIILNVADRGLEKYQTQAWKTKTALYLSYTRWVDKEEPLLLYPIEITEQFCYVKVLLTDYQIPDLLEIDKLFDPSKMCTPQERQMTS